MNEKNINWNDLQLFLFVAREGGLSAAAKLSQCSPATLGRRMHALERNLGKELFIRHDRGYQLLAEGHLLLQELTTVESKIAELSILNSATSKPLIKISAGTWTTLHFIQHIERLSPLADLSRIRFISTEEILDITHREIVIGIRNSRPTDDNLVCRKLKRVDFAPYSTSNAPEQWIKVQADTASANWVDRFIGDNNFYEVSTPRNALDLAIKGQGIALLPTFIGDSYQQLQRTGNIVDELSHDQWLVTHHEDRYLPEVKTVINQLGKMLGN